MARRSYQNHSRNRDSHRVNHHIRAQEIRLIDAEGEQIGVTTPEEGIEKAKSQGMDLVEVAPKARPPVCRIMDYGKYRYQQSKRKTKTKSVSLKTIQMRPKTDDHDLETKLRRAKRFLRSGDKVKFVMRMRGRERSMTSRWVDLLSDTIEDLRSDLSEEEDLRIVQAPHGEGWRITAIVEPTSTTA